MTPRFLVGIDLGTTHTSVAYAEMDRPSPRPFLISQNISLTEQAALPLLSSNLYAPLSPERALLHDNDGYLPGKYARQRGMEVPGRAVLSAKSWLCHSGVDREEAILPWGTEDEEISKISPVEASAKVLAYVRDRWREVFSEHPLEAQEIVLTVPASFDPAARELTLTAVAKAGLTVKLLEEPQAAFHDWVDRQGERALAELLNQRSETTVLVCDVGGGTTDFTLIRVTRTEGELELRRIAVGDHLLLGGDNMDLALAHFCEPRLSGEGATPGKLSPARFAQLVAACRSAKELLMGDDPPEETSVVLLGGGSRLLAATRRMTLRREDAERLLLDGFFPEVPLESIPVQSRGALISFGLPYARDPAITRHLAHFLRRHGATEGQYAIPDAIVLNGGVFHGRAFAERLAFVMAGWTGIAPRLLQHVDPDLAVARGAVVYGLAQRGRGYRILGGSPRGYYLGIDRGRAICILPRGTEPGVISNPTFVLSLLVGQPARFELYASSGERNDPPGSVVSLDTDEFSKLPPIATTIDASSQGELPVRIEAVSSELGTLELSCVEQGVAVPRRFRLAFQLRPKEVPAEQGDGPQSKSAIVFLPSRSTMRPAGLGSLGRIEEAGGLLDRVFGKGGASEVTREVKDLLRDLEKCLGERSSWSIELGRALFDRLMVSVRARRRSPEHERLFWLLTGYTLRPGIGYLGDTERVELFAKLWPEGVHHRKEHRVWQQYWIAWRRVAAGLDENTQVAFRDGIDPFLQPNLPKKIARPESLDDMLSLASWLERPPAARREELGSWLIERTWVSKEAKYWEAIGRLGARILVYTSAHQVLTPRVVEPWLEELLKARWEEIASAPLAATRMARRTGDRARDVSERLREEVLRRLEAIRARPAWIAQVAEVVQEGEREHAEAFGESLPVGFRLLGGASG